MWSRVSPYFHRNGRFKHLEVKRMLGQRLETSLKSQTLPRLDGQDEDSEVLESQFEILSIANSCPDLTVLEIETLTNEVHNVRNSPVVVSTGIDVVDGILYKTVSPNKNAASFRRSTSLSSLGVECVDGSQSDTIDNGGTGNAQPGRVPKVIGQLEKSLKKEVSCQLPSDFIRTALRASHGGTTGYLHKSISSPSVTQYFVGTAAGKYEHYQKPHHRTAQSDAHQHSTKRSFFRRKHKSKGNLMNSHPPSVPRYPSNKMNGILDKQMSSSSMNGDVSQSYGLAALNDPSLGLQAVDAECWALSMSPDVVSRLGDKEVKRQEHMYELIITEKHHCLTLALMQHLFVGDMKKSGYARHARLLFPDLNKLLEVHFAFLRRMRERQMKFRDLGQPMDTLSDILVEQFTSDQWDLMIRLYGLLCASHKKSLDIFNILVIKDQKFASLVASWDKESLLSRKNVKECLLLVVQRITKYPLLIEPILKTSTSLSEKEHLKKSLNSSRELNSAVNERVAQRQRLEKYVEEIDPKSYTTVGQRRRGREDIISLPSRRLLFQGQIIVNGNRSSVAGTGAPAPRNTHCTVLILTDSLVFIQKIGEKCHFVTPPGIVMLNNLIVRENAGQNSSLFLVLGTGTAKPEMIDLQVIHPPNREIWMEGIRSAISKCVEETETGSDGDEEVDATELSDIKTTKALEELQEHDKQLLTALRSRTRLIESLRADKPHHWIPNNLDGKDGLLNSLSASCHEVQRVITTWEANENTYVNRSASCVGEHGAQLLALPKRADTFGGFDSQQRSAFDLPLCTDNKLLMEIVMQLSHLCGEMFSQMVPQLMPSVYQSHHQLQRRMEDLREAQQRLETEKALFQQELASQKKTIERERNDLFSLKQSLQKEQDDIIQQREQLYRKLEALQKQGIRPPLDPVSPLSGAATTEKVPTNPVPARRPVPQVAPPASSIPSNNQPVNGVKNKQQLPLHLAASSSFKAGKTPPSTSSTSDSTPSLRNSLMGSFKGSASGTNISQNLGQVIADPSRVLNQNSRVSTSSSRPAPPSQQVQQLLPLRLSEGNASKTASLPRGVGSRSVASMMSQMDQSQQAPQLNRNSVSSNTFPYGGYVNATDDTANLLPIQSNSSFLYGPAQTAGLRRQYMESQQNQSNRNGSNHENFINSADTISVSHRRSGSSPVPMSAVPPRRTAASEIHYHQHPFFKPRDDDPEKILFL